VVPITPVRGRAIAFRDALTPPSRASLARSSIRQNRVPSSTGLMVAPPWSPSPAHRPASGGEIAQIALPRCRLAPF